MESVALLVIDVQDIWVNAVAEDFPDFCPSMVENLKKYRANGCKIIHIRSRYSPDELWQPMFQELNPEKIHVVDDTNAHSCALEIPGEDVILKSEWNAFSNLELGRALEGIRQVHIAGLITSVCVQHTAYGAFSAGYDVSVIAGCVADRSPERHQAALRLYGNYMYKVI